MDTGRIIPLDRTWITHVYHHHTMQDRKLSMMPVIYTIVSCTLIYSIVTIIDTFFSFQRSCSSEECMTMGATRSM